MAPACEPIKSSIELATWCSRQLLVLLHRLLWSLLVSGAGSPLVPSLFFLLLSALFLSMWVCIVLLGRFPPACEVHQGYSQTVKKWPPFPITFLWLPWKLHIFKGAWVQGKCSEVCLFFCFLSFFRGEQLYLWLCVLSLVPTGSHTCNPSTNHPPSCNI